MLTLLLALACHSSFEDADGDGVTPAGGDCNDAEAAIHPGAVEVCNGLDDDCDGTTDGADAVDGESAYLDNDGDGYGGASTEVCDPEGEDVTDIGGDCDDEDASVYPGAEDPADGVDRDCDGDVDVPRARIDAPADGAIVYADVDLALAGRVLDVEGLQSVSLTVDGEEVVFDEFGGDVSAAVVVDAGEHVIELRAEDAAGHVGSDAVTIQAAENEAPTCVIDSPAEGTRFETGEEVELQATVSDANQAAETLEVRVDAGGTLLAHSGPGTEGDVAWAGVLANGVTTLTVETIDELELECSTTVEITVGSCPDGYDPVGELCISDEAQQDCIVSDAEANCAADGATVCTLDQLDQAGVSAVEMGAVVATAVYTGCCCPCPDNSYGYAFMDDADDEQLCECWTFCSLARDYFCCTEQQ